MTPGARVLWRRSGRSTSCSRLPELEPELRVSQGIGQDREENLMAKKAKTAKKAAKRRYSKSSGSDVENEMRRYKKGTAKSGAVAR